MKKNIAINLSGRLFNIDEDAYQMLKYYIDTLRRYYSKHEGDSEIADDIEARIAELFDELKANGVEAININHVQSVISRIGELEDLAPEENTTDDTNRNASANSTENVGQKIKESVENSARSAYNTIRSGKRFYRDMENKMVCGVLAGCAQFFGGSPLAWRIGFLLTFVVLRYITKLFHLDTSGQVLFFVFTYLAFAVLAPKAENPEDVLLMKGKDVTPQNIGEEVKKQAKKAGSVVGNAVGSFFGFIGKAILFVVAFGLSIAAIVLLCFGVVFLTDPSRWFGKWFGIDFNWASTVLDAVQLPLYIFFGAIALLAIVLLYCIFHSIASSLGNTPSMGFKQRLIWLFLFIAGCVTLVASLVKTFTMMEPYKDQIRQEWYDSNAANEQDVQLPDTLATDTI